MTEQAPANWHPDPFGRHELRYWDGGQWTPHVASRGRQEIDPPVGASPVPTVNRASKKAQRDVRRAGVAAGAQVGGGTLFTEPVLVVNHKAKLIEINAEYAVYHQHGQQIGAVREVGQRPAGKPSQPSHPRRPTTQKRVSIPTSPPWPPNSVGPPSWPVSFPGAPPRRQTPFPATAGANEPGRG